MRDNVFRGGKYYDKESVITRKVLQEANFQGEETIRKYQEKESIWKSNVLGEGKHYKEESNMRMNVL